jgi:2-iminobutanoate/2-iminopropanoate deaminase
MSRTLIRTDALMVPIAHFSHGLRVGNEIHLGATAGTDANRRLAGTPPGLTDARGQADRMYRNMKLALELLGGSLQDVVRLKTYVTDWRDLGGCEEAYGEHFRAPHPSRSIVASWGFPLPFAVVEAELTAVVGPGLRHHHGVAGGESAADALSALAAQLRQADLQMRDVVKVTATLAELRDYPAFEAAFTASFRAPYPARTITVAPLSHPRRRLELETVAVPGGGEPVHAPGLTRCAGACSLAMRAGKHLYVSAQPGIGADGRFANGVEQQTRAAWRRIHALVEASGLDPADVVRTNNWLTDWRSYDAFNAGYGEFVRPPYPPRATVIGGMLDAEALVQIEALAHGEARGATILESVA